MVDRIPIQNVKPRRDEIGGWPTLRPGPKAARRECHPCDDGMATDVFVELESGHWIGGLFGFPCPLVSGSAGFIPDIPAG